MKKATQTKSTAEKELNRNAAAVVAASIPKNFRQQVDMEAFYRFVYENDLRLEALDIITSVRAQKVAAKAAKSRVKQ